MNFFPEVAANFSEVKFSGGGFSNYFPRPDYQNLNKVVPAFLKRVRKKYKGLYKCVFCRDLTRPILTL